MTYDKENKYKIIEITDVTINDIIKYVDDNNLEVVSVDRVYGRDRITNYITPELAGIYLKGDEDIYLVKKVSLEEIINNIRDKGTLND